MDRAKLEKGLAELPLLGYFFIDPRKLEFSDRVRTVCREECPRYGKTWACPPAVGTVENCRCKCTAFENCLMIATATEVSSISNMREALDTRAGHEDITDAVGTMLREL